MYAVCASRGISSVTGGTKVSNNGRIPLPSSVTTQALPEAVD